MSSPLEDVLDRLYSDDANERVKAANQIGELGGPTEAPIVLKVVYEDESSTVRQMAIQSYYEILRDDAYDGLKDVLTNHTDDYVKIYALSVLEKCNNDESGEVYQSALKSENPRIRATVVKSILHSNSQKFASGLLELLKTETDELVIRNILECFGLWKFKPAREYLRSMLQENTQLSDPENFAMLLFALSALGEKDAYKRLEEEEIDEFIRIKFNDQMYRGKQGLIDLLKKI